MPVTTRGREDQGSDHEAESVGESVEPVNALDRILQRLDRLEAKIDAGSQDYSGNQNNGTNQPSQPPRATTALSVKPPDPVKPEVLQSGVTLEKFDAWRDAYEDYVACTGLDLLPRAQQNARFRGFLSTDMRAELAYGIGITDWNSVDPAQIMDIIRTYLRDRVNIAVDRVKFEERKQHSGESFDEYLVALRKLAGNADLCTACYDTRLATRIMVGVASSETRKKLLAMKPFPSLSKVVDTCRSDECARSGDGLLCDGASAVHIVKAKPKSSGVKSHGRSNNSATKKGQCGRCGYDRHEQRSECPAQGQVCKHCGVKGHFARVCRKKDTSGDVSQGNTKKVQVVRLEVSSARKMQPKAPKVAISVHHEWVDHRIGGCLATPDTGSEGTIAGVDVMEELGIDEANIDEGDDGDVDLVAANGQKIECIGRAPSRIEYKGVVAKDTVYFCRGLKGMLLPWYLCVDLGILPRSYPEPSETAVNAVDKETKVPEPTIVEVERAIGPIPQDPSEQDVLRVKDQLLRTFEDVFDSSETLKPMDCPPLKIHLKANAKPFCLRVPRQIPLAYQEKVKVELGKLESQGILAPQGDEPSEWCHAIVVVIKPNGDVRVCVDLVKLNEYVDRPIHPFKAPLDAVTGLPPDAKYFTVLDATKGYFQMELDKDSQHLTVFITPWGRYRFLRAPMGLASTGDEFCRQGDLAFHDIGNMTKVVDDMLEYDSNFRDHVGRVWKTLQRCREKRITLNGKKMQFAQPEVRFVGYKVGVNGIKADPEKVKAILDFPAPQNITELRGFFGIVNQLKEFSADIANAAEALRPLLSTKNVFVWSTEHEASFKRVKKAIASPPALAHFDEKCETALETDASRKGLGFVLMQMHDQGWRPVMYGSRRVTGAESRYAVIELEMLGAVFAINKCRTYLKGWPFFELVTDHKPLVPILNDYTMDQIENPRLLRLRDKIAGYVFRTIWRKGKERAIPDALSRAPLDEESGEESAEEKNIRLVSIRSVETSIRVCLQLEDENLRKVSEAIAADEECQAVIEVVSAGIPTNWMSRWPTALPYRKMLNDISVVDGILMVGSRVVVPRSLRREMLQELHASHQGVEKTRKRARACLYWPGMNADITNMVNACPSCQVDRPSLCKQPMVQTPTPEWVFQDVSADLFSYAGNHYMVYVDRLSGWPVVAFFGKNDPNTSRVVRKFEKYFTDLGVPVRMRTDNGPQFASAEFKRFLSEWGVRHTTSSPHYPQSNGHAEAGVKAMKALISKTGPTENTSFRKGLLEYRNCPIAPTGKSPAEMLFGHPVRSKVIMHRAKFRTDWVKVRQDAEVQGAIYKEKQKGYYNQSAKSLCPLNVGDSVVIQTDRAKKWDKQGTVVKVMDDHRSYLVKLPGGNVYRRNRRFLRQDQGSPDVLGGGGNHGTQTTHGSLDNRGTMDEVPGSSGGSGEEARASKEATKGELKELRRGTRARKKTQFFQARGRCDDAECE